MKKFYLILIAFAVAAMASLSCTREETNAPGLETGEIEVTLTTGEITKTNYDGSAIGWLSTDKLGVMNESLDENHQFTQASYDGVRENTTFSGTVAAIGTHYAYYPYSSTMKIGSGAVITVPSSQVLQSNDSFAANADLLVSEPINVGSISATIDGVRFRRLMSFIDFQFVDGSSAVDLSSEAIESLTVTAEVNLVGKVTLNPKTGELSAITDGSKSVYIGRVASAIIGASHNYAGIVPQTLAEGSELTLTVNTVHHKIQKTLTVPAGGIELKPGHIQPFRITITDADFVPTLKRVWGKYSTAGNYWYDDVSAGGASMAEAAHARSLAMDDEYVYLPKSSAYAAVIGISISDKSSMVRVPTTGMIGSTFQTSCARILKNTDPSVNSGKDVLLVSNLSAGDEAQPFAVYAYVNGTGSAPERLAAFIYDAGNDTNDWRRYGDRFCVNGTWASGKLYCPSFNASKSVLLTVANGARTNVEQIWTASKAEGIIDASVYPGGSSILFTNASQALYASVGAGTNAGWALWPGVDKSELVDTWGYQFFAFNGKNYIARVKRLSGVSAKLQIFEDTAGNESGFIATVSGDPLYEAYVQGEDSTDSPKSSAYADCAVHFVGGTPYIAALLENGGLSLFKLEL